MNNNKILRFIPVMFCFFAMGFVDLVGTASNYVKSDLSLNDTTSNLMPSLVFFWFLIFSIPTGMLMNRIGRKKTVLLSLVITIVSLLLPLLGDSFPLMLVSFSLLGIGNALMQTSLNPLVATVMQGGNLASTLTFGQFVKAIASFMAPYIAMWGAMASIPSFGLGWRVLFPIYMIIGVLATLLLFSTPIVEEPIKGKPSSFIDCVKLLGKPIVLLSFLGIMCHVGIDVGTNTTAPKILMERLGITLNDAMFSTSLYFVFRTLGSASYEQSRVLHHLCYHDGPIDVRTHFRALNCRALHRHCSCGLRQQQHLLDGVCPSIAKCTRQAERSKRTHDYGTLWRNNIPPFHGTGQRRIPPNRSRDGNGNRSNISFHLYSKNQ